jgi:multidrug efflux pump
LVTLSEKNGPLQNLAQFSSISISFNLAKGASLGDAVDAIRKAEADIGSPASFNTAFLGALSAFQSNELLLIAAAVVAVYIVLGMLYESFVHPVTILSTLPSAGVGGLLALRLFGG